MAGIRLRRLLGVTLALLALAGCAPASPPTSAPPALPALVGAWRSNLKFSSGGFAALKDLQFMYVFNAGGTLTESSNYDGAPPVPPAYGVWREVAPDRFEAKCVFFVTAAPRKSEDIVVGGGWLPAGHGVFTERIIMAADRQSFDSMIRYEAFDASGKRAEGSGEARGHGVRIDF